MNNQPVDLQSYGTRLSGELNAIDLIIIENYPYDCALLNIGNLKKQILAWHETEKQKYAMAYADDIIGKDKATHHDHPFLSDYSMGKINITINDMILYDKSQHFTKETKEWFEKTINEAIDGQLQQKCNNETRNQQRELNKSKGGKI